MISAANYRTVLTPFKRHHYARAPRSQPSRFNAVIQRRVQHNQTTSKSPNLTTTLTSFAIGCTAGTLGSLAGMGGGFVMIPLLTWKPLQLSQHQAHGTSLAAVMATGLSGAVAYGNAVHWEAALAIALPAMVTARWGAWATSRLSGRALRKALGVLLLIMGPCVPAKAYYMEQYDRSKKEQQQAKEKQTSAPKPQEQSSQESNNDTTVQLNHLKRLQAPAAIGICSGFLAGLFGVGGGTLVVPALTVAMDQEITTHHQALATSLAAMTLPAAVGTYTHALAGNVAWRVAPPLAVGALVGAYVGGKWALHTNESVLRWGFSVLLTVLGIRTLWKA